MNDTKSPFPQFTTPTPTPALPVSSGSSSSAIIKIIIGIVIVGIVGTGVALATRVWDPLWNPFRPNPEKVIGEMINKTAEIETLHSKISIIGIGKENGQEKSSSSWVLDGDLDVRDAKNFKSDFNIDIGIKVEGIQVSFKAETKSMGKDFYIRIIELPVFFTAFFEMFGMDTSKIKQQWIKIEGTSPEPSPQAQQEQKEIITQFKQLFKENKIYSVKKELPDEKIGEEKVYHYVVALDKEGLKRVIPEMLNVLEKYSAQTGAALISPEEIAKDIDEFFKKVGELTADLWIGKKDGFLYKVKSEKEIDLSKFDSTSKGTLTVKLEMEDSNFNLPVKIEAPTDFKTLEEIFPLMPDIFNLPVSSGIPFEIK